MPSLKERLYISLLEKHQAWHEARGMLSPSKKLNANQLTTCKALAGAATIGNAFLYEFTGGMVSYDLSYSYEDGFGASVGSGMKIVEGLGVGSTLRAGLKTIY
ncbi:hypothetical protein LEP1GSC039_3274 [Leptospira santarosai str. 2000027870]|uniref:hypothetical protein n=1 Tax=Leptospira santarosai TaxID=28183 RepID=UPI0002BDB4BE|nr:hypothetical protein [Leptospira santarosai]EMM88433.1 hypothetical protein LEP1GSC039_3274 [Leptospira santarosai str. 2000027870]